MLKIRMKFLFVIDLLVIWQIDPTKINIDTVMFDGTSNFQISVDLLKLQNPKLTVMHGVEHTISLFFNYVSKIFITNKLFTAYKEFLFFCSGIYHKSWSPLIELYRDFQKINIGSFSGNDSIMDGYLIGMHRYMHKRKLILVNISPD